MLNKKVLFIIDHIFYDWQKSIVDGFKAKNYESLLYFSNNDEKINRNYYFNFKKVDNSSLYEKYDFLPKEFKVSQNLIQQLEICHIINLSQNPLGTQNIQDLEFYFFNFYFDNKFYSLNQVPLKNFSKIEAQVLFKKTNQKISLLKKSIFPTFKDSPQKNYAFFNFILSDILFSVIPIDKTLCNDHKNLNTLNEKINFKNFCIYYFSVALHKIILILKSVRNGFTYQKWNIAQIDQSVLEINNAAPVLRKWLFNLPAFLSYADPFLVLIKSRLFILFENFDFKTMRGKISMKEYTTNKVHDSGDNLIHIIGDDSHFSYPHPLSIKNELYFMTENSIHENLFLYKINDADDDTERFKISKKIKILSHANFVDPTPFFHDNIYWIFVGKHEPYTAGSSKLYLYFSEKYDGPYTEHIMSPIVTDICSARSAGNIFIYNNKIIRPAQNCLNNYGNEINLMEITELTTHTYSEKFYKKIISDQDYPDGCHHITVLDKIILIDGLKNKFSILIFFVKINYKIKLKCLQIKRYCTNK